ncbi:MAG: dodecin family protein [Saprospiraceae bacterium]
MSIVKVIEIMTSSKKSWEDAAQQGVLKASKTLSNIKSAWVQDQSITVDKGKIKEFRVTLKISFELK